MISLLDLPAELVLQILSFLIERKPHSMRHLHAEPSEALLQSGYTPVKDLSLTCQHLRNLCLQTLFANVKLTLTNDRVSMFTERSVSFIQDHDLVRGIESVLFYQVASDAIDNEHECINKPRCNMESQILWVISQLNPAVVTIMLPPSCFQDLMPYDLRESDDWAFQIPYQVLHLTRPADMPPACVSVNDAQDNSILNMHPWGHCTFNEGSSIRAYSTYEYFHKHVPSIFSPINEPKMLDAVWRVLPYLTSLDYVAIFPFSVRHMQQFCNFLTAAAPSLQHLRTRLSPTRGNGVLDDKEAMGTCQRTDIWSELEVCYSYLADWLRQGYLDSIIYFTVLEYDNPELRDAIHRVCDMGADWAHVGNGEWVKLVQGEGATSGTLFIFN